MLADIGRLEGDATGSEPQSRGRTAKLTPTAPAGCTGMLRELEGEARDHPHAAAIPVIRSGTSASRDRLRFLLFRLFDFFAAVLSFGHSSIWFCRGSRDCFLHAVTRARMQGGKQRWNETP